MKTGKILTFALCLAWSLTAAAAWAAEAETEYMAVLLAGKKIGHSVHTRKVEGDRVTTTEEMVMTLGRMGTSMTIRQVSEAAETTEGKPLSFRGVQDMGFALTEVVGTVGKDGKVQVTTTSGQSTSRQTIDWPEGAVMAEGLRLLSKAKGMAEGTKYTAKAFEPSLLKAMDVDVAIGGPKEVDLLGRVVSLTEVTTTLQAPQGKMSTTSYVDKDLNALKTIVPMLGMQLEVVACGKEFALSKADVLEFFGKLLVASPQPLKGVDSAGAIVYRIEPTGKDAKLKLLSGPSQTVAGGADGGFTVTVRPVQAPKGAAMPYKGTDAETLKALKPTRYLQSDEKEIAALARKAVGDCTDAGEAAGRIEQFVRKHIATKDLSVGYASALEVARSGQGDCSEHAVLAAALCRAAGIPSQIVTGLAYVKRLGARSDLFAPHAWFRAFIGDKWIDYDAALEGFDAGHIAMTAGDGDPDEFFGILGTLGNLKIVSVQVGK